LIDPVAQFTAAELQLLDPAGKPPQLLLQLGKTHFEPRQAAGILSLDQPARADPIAPAVEMRRRPRDRSARLAGCEEQTSGHRQQVTAR
jgi:hypothetical protein